jgi:hypothetical protein
MNLSRLYRYLDMPLSFIMSNLLTIPSVSVAEDATG